MIGLLAAAPLFADRMITARQEHQDARDDDLVKSYECYPIDSCAVDFNGDGVPARFETAKAYAVGSDLIVTEAGQEVLRLAYDQTDNTLRTHLAIHNENGRERLLVYDGVSHQPALRTAYEWNGVNIVNVKPSLIEEEIISAMAAHDDTGGWHERTLRPFKRIAYLGAYYIVFLVLALMLYRRIRQSWSRTLAKTGTISDKQAID